MIHYGYAPAASTDTLLRPGRLEDLDIDAEAWDDDGGKIHCRPAYLGRPVMPRATVRPSGLLRWVWPPHRGKGQIITGALIEWGRRRWSFGLSTGTTYHVKPGEELTLQCALHELR